MNARILRTTFAFVLALSAVLLINPTASAQGTANGPVTQHQWDGGVDIFIGGVLDPLNPDPIEIDLDPNGPPWTKEIFPLTPGLSPFPGQIFLIHETIVNAGTEAWTDWHEHILDNGLGVIPAVWNNVQVMVNGVASPIGVQGLGTSDLWIDPISISVKPGDILEIWKELLYTGPTSTDPTVPFLVIEEYPTPEPASLALLALGGLSLVGRRRSFTPRAADHLGHTKGECL